VALTVENRPPAPPARAMKQNVGEGERVASLVGGGALALIGLVRGGASGTALTLAGGGLLLRGLSGFSLVYKALGVDTADDAGVGGPLPQGRTVRVDRSVLINRSPEELYRSWRDFESLPTFMKHLRTVTVLDERRSHWVATGPLGQTVEWDAEIVEDRPGELIAWRSTERADIANAGSVSFRPAPHGRGTVVRVLISYDPPAGQLGRAYLAVFGEEPSQQVHEDLRRFKARAEAGEILTTAGQPACR